MDSMDERKIWKHWAYLKNELYIDDLLDSMVEAGVFTATQRRDILTVLPNTRQMKAEKFLNALIKAGDKGFETFCNVMRRDGENRYRAVMDRLEISDHPGAHAVSYRPQSVQSSASLAYGVYISQLIRYGRACSNYEDFIARGQLLTTRLQHQGYTTPRLKSTFRKFFGRQHDIVGLYEKSASASTELESRPDSAWSSNRPVSRISNSSGSTDVSSQSVPSRDGETGERNIRRKKAWRSESSASESIPEGHSNYNRYPRAPSTGEPFLAPIPASSQSSVRAPPPQRMNIPKNTTSSAMSATVGAASGACSNDEEESAVDMKALEQELVRIAPTIAELFQKFAKTTSKEPVSEEEIQNVKAENERLRKTNRALIDKLNSFQQRIISLQLENKKLKEEGEGVKEARDELDKKEFELQDLQKRLEEQKQALEEKELELNNQLLKIKDIEEDIQRQKEQIVKLETLHEEGQIENERQQGEIIHLQEDKRKQQQQILKLEFKQRLGEERLQSLDDRMKQLEQPRRLIRRPQPQPKPKRALGMFYN